MTDVDELCVNILHFLAADAVPQAKSGHSGMPLGVAPVAYVLWNRFVLSAGHASALLLVKHRGT